MKLIVWMIREILKMLNQYAVDYHVTSQPALLPPFRDPGGMLNRSVGMLSRKDGPPDIWDTHGFSGKRFCKSTDVFFITLSRTRVQSVECQRVRTHITACNEWTPNTRHNFGSEMPVRTVSQKIHSTLKSVDFQRIMEQTNNDCRFRIFILTNSITQQHLLVGR